MPRWETNGVFLSKINQNQMERNQIMDGKKMVVAEEKHLIPLDKVNGYDVRPGFYGINGATALREVVNFTVCSLEATAVGACH